MSADNDVRAGAHDVPLSPAPPSVSAAPDTVRAGNGTLVGAVLAFAMTVVAIASVVVVPLLGELSLKLHASATTAAWTLIIVTLISGVTTPVSARLGDLFGYRKVLIGSFTLMTIGTVICAVAQSMPVFLTGRVLQGFVGGVLPVAVGVVRNNVRHGRVRLVIGILVAGEGVGVGVGFILGGLMQRYAWNVTFWVLLAPMAVALALIVAFVPATAPERGSRRVDVPGTVLLMAGILAILLPLSKGAAWGWSSASTTGLFAGGVVLLAAWGWWELHVSDPLIDLRPFANAHFLLPNVAGLAFGMTVGAVFLLFVGYAEVPHAVAGYGFGVSTLRAGSFLLPDAVCVLIAGPLSGIVAHRIGARPVIITGAILVAGTFLLLAPGHDQQWELYIGSAVFGTAVACSLTGMYSIVAEAVGPERSGMAQGVNSLVYAVGASAGSAAVTALLSAHVITGTSLSEASGYTNSYILCGALGLLALAIVGVEARIRGRRLPAAASAVRSTVG